MLFLVPILQLEGLTRRFDRTVAVDSVSFGVAPGEMIAVIGPSEAGKSTLLRLINRLVTPSSGAILFEGAHVAALSGLWLRAWRARWAMIFQQFRLVKRDNVITNVLLARLRAL